MSPSLPRSAPTPGPGAPQGAPLPTRTARGLELLRKSWTLHAVILGVVAGTGALLFHYLLHEVTHLTVREWMGVRPPSVRHELTAKAASGAQVSVLALLLLPTLGGLLSGWLTYTWAPEAKGHGTDGAIHAFHRLKGVVRPIVPVIKLVATLFTLGFGGSGGSEGPIAQIGSGFGSNLGRWLDLGPRRTRILLVAGMGAGVAAIFEAPLAAMIFAGEILYRGADIDGEVLVPTAIASVVSYSTYVALLSTFSGVVRWSHMFEVPPWEFTSGLELIGYTALAAVCALMARAWIHLYYGVETAFHHAPVPPWIRPGIGGFLTGFLAWGSLHPDGTGVGSGVLAGGYGMLQKAIDSELTLGFVLTLLVLKALATAFSIGSGGSGGIFGPSLVLGGMVGSAVGMGLQALHPALVAEPGSYTVIGMAALFGAAAHAPVCSVIMVAEITRSYGLLVPSIWTCTLAFVLVGKRSLYLRQVDHLEDSPAHQGEIRWNILNDLRCGDEMQENPATMSSRASYDQIQDTLLHHRYSKFPVLDADDRLVGVITLGRLREFFDEPELRDVLIAEDAMDPIHQTASPDTSLADALHLMNRNEWNLLCIAPDDEPRRLMGILTRRDILLAYSAELARRDDDESGTGWNVF